jgi:hypothetical protein
MLFRRFFIILLIVIVVTFSVLSLGETLAYSPCYGRASNLITDRVTGKQLKHWYAIRRVALAEDANQRPLHPILHRLWNWAETGNHLIYIELINGNGTIGSTAGRFRIVKLDPTGKRHISLIQLYLNTIDQAYTGGESTRSDRLVPLKGLNKYERYAEVLGHELAHAHHVLTNLERTKQVYDLVEETNILLLAHHIGKRQKCCRELGPELRRRIKERDTLLHELELYAERVETEVWRELLAGQKLGALARRSEDQARNQLPVCRNVDIAMKP